MVLNLIYRRGKVTVECRVCQNGSLAVDVADTASDSLVPGAVSTADTTVC